MSAGAATLLVTERSAEKSNAGRNYDRVFSVICTAATDTEVTVLGASGLPAIGDAHPGDAGAKVKSLRPRRLDGFHWQVTARYEVPQSGGGAFDEDPLNADPDISLGSVPVEYAIFKDNTGTAILLSNGRPPDPGLTQRKSNLTITIAQNQADCDPATINTYLDTLNSANVTVAGWAIPDNRGLMDGIEAVKMWAPDGDAYWRVTYRIIVNMHESWQPSVLNQDYYQLVGSNLKPCEDADGQPVQKPALLDAAGAQTTTPSFSAFTTFYTAAWSGLSLPTTR